MEQDIIKTTFTEYVAPLNTEHFSRLLKEVKVDKYTKKLDTIRLTKLLIFAQLEKIKSLTDISLKLSNNEDLQKEMDLDSISASQLSRKLRDLNMEIYESIFQDLVQQLSRQIGMRKATEKLARLQLIDSSTLSMCITRHRWAEFRKTKAGVKIHLRLTFYDGLVYPDKANLTPAKPSDKTQMGELITVNVEALHVFDRGYVDYRKFDEYCHQGIRFVTRLKQNADIEVIEEITVPSHPTIRKEAIVRLGNKYTYLMRHPLRLIECLDGEGNKIIILTNDFHVSVEEISDIYRKRWQIELFFKWMKQHLKVKHFYGSSRLAVYNQIRIALITFCLTVLMQLKVEHRGKLLTVQKLIRLYWAKTFDDFIRELFRTPSRKSKGRRKWDHERIFQETLQQYEERRVKHLNDLVYDPIL